MNGEKRPVYGPADRDPRPAAQAVADALAKRTARRPAIAFVLGSGWNGVADALEGREAFAYSSLAGMPVCGVAGHAGNFVFGKLAGADVLLLQGRFHLYEGRPMADVLMPVAVASALGVSRLVLTNAAGGADPAFRAGDLMLLSDHINMTGQNPLVGIPAGERPVFVDMSRAYDEGLRAALADACRACGISCREGVYMQLLGPSYETPAEVRAFRALGADTVGMSTAVEAIYARYAGLRVAGISCITNAAAGLSAETLRHEDVLAVLEERRRSLGSLLLCAVPKLLQA